MNRAGQAWGIDLIIAMIIFSVGIASFYLYIINSASDKEKIEEMRYDAKIISEIILSSGYPTDWNASSVVKIGIIDDDKINETKLENFYELASVDYEKTKAIFNTGLDYIFFFANLTINNASIIGIGKPGISPENINSENIVKISRIVNYKNKLTMAHVYAWE